MSILTVKPSAFTSVHNEEGLFSLEIKQTRNSTLMTMRVMTEIVNTREIPKTLPILRKYLPTILVATCFNDEALPFAVEVKRTEIGHLFEHILLENLCKMKIANGAQDATFSGRTYWNWTREPKGTFQIVIKAGYKEGEIFQTALIQSMSLVKEIMVSKIPQASTNTNIPLPSFIQNHVSISRDGLS